MSASRVTPHVDRLIAALAATQFGIVTAEQLAAIGIDRNALAYRVRVGRLHRLHRGVYAVGHPHVSAEGRWLAAVLACGPGAVLSHRAAAAHWDLRPSASARIDVTVPSRSPRHVGSLVTVHRTRRAVETAVHRRIPITTPARTLLDLAGVLTQPEMDRAVERAETLRLFDLASIRKIIDDNPGRVSRPLTRAVAAFDDAPIRSELERRFLALCAGHGIERPRVNGLVGGFEVDFHWPSARLVVETDGHDHHGTRPAFERDRRRDASLTVAGWRVVRFTWRQVTADPAAVATTLRALLSQV